MFNVDTFRNLDNEFKDILVNFVYEEMNKKEIREKSLSLNISAYLNEKYSEKNKIDNLNEEKYSEEITKYMLKNLEFKNNLIKKAK